MKKKIFSLIFLFFMAGCFDPASSGVSDSELLPRAGLTRAAYPNDRAENDSLAENLAEGVLLQVHPGADYQLSFQKDGPHPSPELQLYRVIFNSDSTRYRLRQVRRLKAKEADGRFIYSFTCEESSHTYWAATLADASGNYYTGKVRDFLFEGKGSYSERFNLNLIVTGKYGGTADLLSVTELAAEILSAFRTDLAPGGIRIDTIFVQNAENHPVFGSKYSSEKPWLAGTSSKDFLVTELGGWGAPPEYDALDLVLVHRIDAESVLGNSLLFGGSLGGGRGSTVVIGTHFIQGSEEFALDSKSIAHTALHESAHFFGVRHTSATLSDLENENDFSNNDDGLDDTPFCMLINSFSKKNKLPSDFKIFPRIFSAQALALSCPDENNIMFPYTIDGVESIGFSKEQLQQIRGNLSILKH
ncbi:MAG: hypothetical protein LBR60_05590 [Fibrobacter sp.]|jgi:hypothetical protein|nr:hypothetical protein [Fibrobacter sp.]